MAWVRIDDQYPDHPKLKAVGAIGLAIQTAAICYCGRYLTDGLLSFSAADALVRSVLAPLTLDDGSIWTVALTSGMSGQDAEGLDWKAVMVKAGLWEQRDGGFAIHDYLRYNPSRRDFTQLLKNKRIAGKAGGQASAQARAQACAQAKFNNDPSPSLREETSPSSPPKLGDASAFETFWQAYPNKKGKLAARRIWNRVAKEEGFLPRVLAAIANQRDSPDWQKEHGRFIPHPATWLNQGRWEDEVVDAREETYGYER